MYFKEKIEPFPIYNWNKKIGEENEYNEYYHKIFNRICDFSFIFVSRFFPDSK
jgi:hypothetical protein